MGVFSVPEISVIDNRDYAFGLMAGILGICCRAAYSHLLAKALMWRTSVISRRTEQNENTRTIGTGTSLASRQKRQINALNLQTWACILGLVTAKGLSLRNVKYYYHILLLQLCVYSLHLLRIQPQRPPGWKGGHSDRVSEERACDKSCRCSQTIVALLSGFYVWEACYIHQ